jgi:hypothetical protein
MRAGTDLSACMRSIGWWHWRGVRCAARILHAAAVQIGLRPAPARPTQPVHRRTACRGAGRPADILWRPLSRLNSALSRSTVAIAPQLQLLSHTLVSTFEKAALQTFGASMATFNVPGAVHTYVEHMSPRGSVVVAVGPEVSHIVALRRPCTSLLRASKPGVSPEILPETLRIQSTAHL